MRRWRAVFETFIAAGDDESADRVSKRICGTVSQFANSRILFTEPADGTGRTLTQEILRLRREVRDLERKLADCERAAVDGK